MWLSFSSHYSFHEKECSGVDTNRTWLHLMLLYHDVSWWVTMTSLSSTFHYFYNLNNKPSFHKCGKWWLSNIFNTNFIFYTKTKLSFSQMGWKDFNTKHLIWVWPNASSYLSLLIQSLTVVQGDKSVLIGSLAAPLAMLATTKQQLSG